MGGQTLPLHVICNICASLQYSVTTHICHRVQRAIEYVTEKHFIPSERQILVSANKYIVDKYNDMYCFFHSL